METENILARIREEMDSRDWNLRDLARQSDVSVWQIYAWYRKDRAPQRLDIVTLTKIAKAFNTDLDYLANGEKSAEEAAKARDIHMMIDQMGESDLRELTKYAKKGSSQVNGQIVSCRIFRNPT